jgi:hypothetical protein
MKIHDLLTEQRLDEKPMGMLKSLGNKAMAALGSGKAQGRVESGTMANQLRKQFDVYIGKTGQDATTTAVIEFLKSKGLPTAAASQAMGVEGGEQEPGTGDQAAQPAAQKSAQQGTEKSATGDQAAKPAASSGTMKGAPGKPTFTGVPEKPADSDQAAQPADDQEPAQGKSLSPSAFGKMAQDLTKPLAGASSETPGKALDPKQPAAQPAGGQKLTAQQQAAKKAELLGRRASGTSIATQTGDGFKKYKKQATQQRIVGANPDGSPKVVQINADLELDMMTGEELLEWVNQMVGEALVLSSKQLDNVFMKAAQEAAKMGFKPGDEIGFAGGFKGAYQQGGGWMSHFDKGKGGQPGGDGSGAAAEGEKTWMSPDLLSDLKVDPKLIPNNIMSQIKRLNYRERQQLLKELG